MKRISTLALALSSFVAITADAAQFDLPIPADSGAFGTTVTVLPNGNFVVTDPAYAGGGSMPNVGAVYLYDGVTLAVISTLTGSAVGDQVGNGFITVLSNGNYLVNSPDWNTLRGAVTWGSAVTGVSGAVSAANSLVGSTAGDQIGSGGVVALNNGNYVVDTFDWNNGAVANAGAVTWGSGTVGVTGVVSAANSLVGSAAGDQIGYGGVAALANGNYVVSSLDWNNGAVSNAGAVTWGNGTIGVTGVVSAANSLVGSTAGDQIGSGGVVALNNGNYVVNTLDWNNGAVANAGAVTWGNGTVGVTGAVSAANSLVGSTAGDQIGFEGVAALSNGNYVVRSPAWHNGAVANAGAVTWGSGTVGVTGVVSAANSLVGSTANDQIGYGDVAALGNGNYVLSSPLWHNGAVATAGAVTWGSGTVGVTGVVASANSLVGSAAGDQVGYGGVAALSNGNYVVRSAYWNGSRGAATWGNGTSGVTGTISAANSLVGSAAGDQIGSGGVAALNNGNYVVSSPAWHNGAVTNVGAATWANGSTGLTSVVASANSLVGSTAGDQVGVGGVAALNNGNYVVRSPVWHNGAVANAGAVTWGSGTVGVTGAVSAANSLVGSAAGDQVGLGVIVLNNSNYVVDSYLWNSFVGAVTWGSGTTGATGAVSSANSLVGSTVNDRVGYGALIALTAGNYVVDTLDWNNGAVAYAGAVSLGDGALGTTGAVSAANSVLGTVHRSVVSTFAFAYDSLNSRLVVGYPDANRVSLFGYISKLLVQQPLNVNLTNGGTRVVGAPLSAQASLTFTIKDVGLGSLTGLGVTIDGADAAAFAVTTNPAASVTFNSSTTFTVRFAPVTNGTKTATLHISSNDSQQNPFNINLIGKVLSFSQDSDGDGLSDAEEFYLAPLGFDWQVSQPNLVSNLFANANGAGLYTTNQIQALNVNTPLLIRDPLTGEFTLTIAVQKSTNLVNFAPFPMSAPQTTINAQGNLQFQFTSPDNAAFFRLEAH